MKTTLRKQFEQFKKDTEQRLWELENPPRHKYGDKVYLVWGEKKDAHLIECICRGEKPIGGEYSRYSNSWWFWRTYILDNGQVLFDHRGPGITLKEDAQRTIDLEHNRTD